MSCDYFRLPMNQARGFVNVDQLQKDTSLEDAARKCGIALHATGSGPEVRIDCPFGCAGDHLGRKEISINTANDEKVFLCHSYQCGFRGNLLALMHGWLNGKKPSGDKLRGTEFQRVRDVLVDRVKIEAKATVTTPTSPTSSSSLRAIEPESSEPNLPLIDSENEAARELADIDSKFIVEMAHMNPAAASYIRQHPCLTPDSMQKWRCGYLPHDGGGDKRGWSLRGHIVYPMLSEEGKVLAWIGRDPTYEQKLAEYNAIRPELRGDRPEPIKHKVPKGFHRGQEFSVLANTRAAYENPATAKRSPRTASSWSRDFRFDVINLDNLDNLDNLGNPAVAICSNRITPHQVEKVTRWSQQLADGKVTLLFDCEPTGDDGAKEALWQLTERGLHVRLGWTQDMHGGAFKGRQPEALSLSEWHELVRDASDCSS